MYIIECRSDKNVSFGQESLLNEELNQLSNNFAKSLEIFEDRIALRIA